MKLKVSNNEIHIATGGRAFTAAAVPLIFLHGSGQSHLSWVLQSRYFAYGGYDVLAPDFPGHGLSSGQPLTSIPEMADFVIALMDELKIDTAVIVGHSQGGLVALELAARCPARVKRLALIATALSIPVNDHLVDSAQTRQPAAIAMMTGWGHGRKAHFYDNSQPGFSHLGFGRALMTANDRRALAADLNACSLYDGGPAAAGQIACPSLVILAGADKMTPIKQGRALAQALKDSQTVEIAGAGHMLPAEEPEHVNRALSAFLDS